MSFGDENKDKDIYSMCYSGRNYNNNNKPWFNKECKQKRDAFHKVQNKYRNNKTIETNTLLNSKAKEFRNELNKRYSLYQTKCANERLVFVYIPC
jgi:hypothetical protein